MAPDIEPQDPVPLLEDDINDKDTVEVTGSDATQVQPEISEPVPTNAISSPGSDTITAGKDLTYNTGHGDFCFGRMIDGWYRSSSISKIVPLSGENIVFQEIGDFQRYALY